MPRAAIPVRVSVADVPKPSWYPDPAKGDSFKRASNAELRSSVENARLDTFATVCASVALERLPLSSRLVDSRDGATDGAILAVRILEWGGWTSPFGEPGVRVEMECSVRDAKGKRVAVALETATATLRPSLRDEIAPRFAWETAWIAMKEASETAISSAMLKLRRTLAAYPGP